MICENCGKREANTHIKRIINGAASQMHLCPECAAKMGYRAAMGGFGSGFGGLLGEFLGGGMGRRRTDAELACDSCGATFEEIARSGIVGCPDCYRTFYDKLEPTFRQLHGNAPYDGRSPALTEQDKERAESENRRKASQLRDELTRAIEEENYERAAQLRDALRAMGE